MGVDTIGNRINPVFNPRRAEPIKEPDPAQKDKGHSGSEDPTNEQEGFSEEKRHKNPEAIVYGKDKKMVPPEDPPGFDGGCA